MPILPNPYYQDTACTIYHGDCREILPLLPKVDTVFSSPPYNQIAATEASGMMKESNHKQLKGYISHKDDMTEDEYAEWQLDVFGLCKEKCAGLMWINHKTRYRDKIGIHPLSLYPWPFYSEIIWDRGVSITLNARKYAPSHEFIYGFGVPHYWDRKNDMKMSVWRVGPEKNVEGHPCPFPLAIVSACVESSTPLDGIVLDPFMGSGTTLRAAKDLGRKAIGIELEEKYCEIAVKRLRQEVLL
jgi:DNA modification methylase